MKITIGILGILGILMLVSVSALYSGESQVITLPEDYDYYSIVGNSSPVYLTVDQDGLNVTITLDKYQQSDEFELIFFNTETITNTVYTSGGGTRTIYEDRYVTQPKFYDRNFTTEKETIVIEPFETLIKETTGYKLWHIFVAIIATLVLAILLYIFIKLLYNNNYEEEEEEENPISWEQRMRENNEIVRKREDGETEY